MVAQQSKAKGGKARTSSSRARPARADGDAISGTVVEARVVRLAEAPDIDDERNVLFSIGDTDYTIATNPSASIGLKYLFMARTQGQDIAVGWMLEELLGSDGYQALMNYQALRAEDLARIIEIAGETLMGAIETPKG